MTIKEVQMVCEAFIDEKKYEQRLLKVETYNTAYLSSLFIGLVLSGKTIPKFSTIYPDEDDTSNVIEEEDRQRIEASILQDKMMEFAKNANEQRKNK